MTPWIEDLTGAAWEAQAGILLRFRHNPPDVQAVPDIQGDLGIDYWIRGSGDIYQCYGPEFATSVSERLRLQKTKLGREIRTFIANGDRIADMIAPSICYRYIFFVPRHDSKELLEYAATKTTEVRNAQLACCAPDFEITVQSLSDFEAERSLLIESRATKPRLVPEEPLDEEVHRWVSDNGELVRIIREKLHSIHFNEDTDQIENVLQETIENYLGGEAALRKLENDYPSIYEQVRRVITVRRRRLSALGGTTSEIGLHVLSTELDGLSKSLTDTADLDSSDADIVSIGTMAQWLADCTLRPR